MPISPVIMARVLTAVKNLLENQKAKGKSAIMEATATGGARTKGSGKGSVRLHRVRDEAHGEVHKRHIPEMTRRERSEYNKIRREENAAKRRAKHGG